MHIIVLSEHTAVYKYGLVIFAYLSHCFHRWKEQAR